MMRPIEPTPPRTTKNRPRFTSIPTDRLVRQRDVHLFRLQEFVRAVGAQLPAMTALLIPAPRRFHVARLHRIHPYDSRAEALHHSHAAKYIARPHCCGEAVWS